MSSQESTAPFTPELPSTVEVVALELQIIQVPITVPRPQWRGLHLRASTGCRRYFIRREPCSHRRRLSHVLPLT